MIEVRENPVELSALDGANPLGFLAALGTLVTLHAAGEKTAKLHWRARGKWVPAIDGVSAKTTDDFCQIIAGNLRGHAVDADADAKRDTAQKAADRAKTPVTKKRAEIKNRRLSRDEQRAAAETELRPVKEEYARKRQQWLTALSEAVPRPELALGKRIDCSDSDYRQFAFGFLENAGVGERDAVDMLAAFGNDARTKKDSTQIEPTPFCFISGSGHQDFLDTARQLIERVSEQRVRQALFEPWTYSDQGLSMRWDPVEDKRYALLDSDPGPAGARTVWMGNLLAYRGMALFPTAPTARPGITGWTGFKSRDDLRFVWPIWTIAASPDVIRSLLQLSEITADSLDEFELGAKGVSAVFQARRIKVGSGANSKLNFSPARALLSFKADS